VGHSLWTVGHIALREDWNPPRPPIAPGREPRERPAGPCSASLLGVSVTPAKSGVRIDLPAWAESCCRCPARPATIYMKTIVRETAEPGIYPKSGPVVIDMQYCAHHANELDRAEGAELSALERDGWTLVRDDRQALIAAEKRGT
jgi:hypothetical protein